jgi:stage III sporulation protein AF
MMTIDAARTMVKNLAMIVMLAAIVDLIIPEGRFKAPLSFVTALFILLSVLQPVTAFLRRDDLSLSHWTLPAVSDTNRWQQEGDQIRQDMLRQAEEELTQKLEEQISAIALLIPGVQEAEAQVSLRDDRRVSLLRLAVRLTETDQFPERTEPGSADALSVDEMSVREKLTHLLQGFYGIEADNIQIEMQRRR